MGPLAGHRGAHRGACGALAGPSEILESQTVKTSSPTAVSSSDAGEHELKRIPDRWRLYRGISSSLVGTGVTSRASPPTRQPDR
jgi:hypothetical protein